MGIIFDDSYRYAIQSQILLIKFILEIDFNPLRKIIFFSFSGTLH